MPVFTGSSYAVQAWTNDSPGRFYSRSGTSLQQDGTPTSELHRLPRPRLRERWFPLPMTFFSSPRPLLLTRRWFRKLLRRIVLQRHQSIHPEKEVLIPNEDDDDDTDTRATNRTSAYMDPFLIPHHYRYPLLTPTQRQEFLEKKRLTSREKIRRVLGDEAAEHVSDIGDAWLSWLEYDREVRVLDCFEDREASEVDRAD
ncbi:hypothetical protein Moror_3135 [Moniliophthora roreri MCA 2997]|uniref:Uncharacterized protein n=2 Tax=Moniliophthora roreri TaxID=221103 RepID=V2X7W4_MONRO|nr:hypothetical protein Moror_3135 [Moniliophthora roreri MCA 2997]